MWEWIASAVAVVAAVAAFWQAYEARKARTGATDAESRTLAASERMAAAIEEQTALARSAASQYRSPWSSSRAKRKTSVRLTLTLRGDEAAHEIEWSYEPKGSMTTADGEWPREMVVGEAVVVTFSPDFATNPIGLLRVEWRRPGEELRREERFSLAL